MVQWLRTCNAGGEGSIPGQVIKIPHDKEQLSLCATSTEPAHSGVHTTAKKCMSAMKDPARRNEDCMCHNKDLRQPK